MTLTHADPPMLLELVLNCCRGHSKGMSSLSKTTTGNLESTCGKKAEWRLIVPAQHVRGLEFNPKGLKIRDKRSQSRCNPAGVTYEILIGIRGQMRRHCHHQLGQARSQEIGNIQMLSGCHQMAAMPMTALSPATHTTVHLKNESNFPGVLVHVFNPNTQEAT